MYLPFMRDRLYTALMGSPEVFDVLLAPLSADDPHWDYQPDPERYSLRSVMAHLADYEQVWLERIRLAHTQDNPTFPPVDRDALEIKNDYAHSSPVETRRIIKARRAELVAYLKELSVEDWQRAGNTVMPAKGTLTIEEMAPFVLVHDGYHMQQTVEWMAARG